MKKMSLIIILIFSAGALGASPSPQPADAYQHYLKYLIEEGEGNLSAAQENLDKALLLAPESAYLHYSAAEIAFRQNLLPKAAESIEKAISLDPKDSKSFILAGQIYWAMGDEEKSEARLKTAVRLNPNEPEALVNLAMAVTPKDPKRAIKLYEDYLSRNPGELEIQERVAQLYSTMGDIEKAKAGWKKALEISPDSIRAHLASAQISEVEKDTATAITHYEAVLDRDPKNLPLLLRVGELHYRGDEMGKAYEAFSLAQSLAPESPSANFWLALVSENRGDWEKAVRLLKVVADRAPEPGVLLRLSYYYAQLGKSNEAIAILKKLADQDPENTDFLRYLAIGYEQNKKYAEAVKVLEQLINIDPENADYYFHLATLQDRRKDFPKTEAALKKAIELEPEFHMALNYLGYSYADRNIKLDEAEEILISAVALDPHNAAYLDSLGWLYFRQGKLRKAEDFLKQATKEGKDPLIWDHLGDVQLALGETVPAIRAWHTSLRHDPNSPGVVKKLRPALAKISNEDKILLLVERARADADAVASLKGLVEIAVGVRKPRFNVRGQIEYEKNALVMLQIPGPLGGPLFLLSRSTDGAVQYGAVHPDLQAVEAEAVQAFGRIEGVLRGAVLGGLNLSELKSYVSVRRRSLVSSSKDVEIQFDLRTGLLSRVAWIDGSDRDAIHIKEYSTKTSPSVPILYEWTDSKTRFVFRLKLIRPLVSTSLLPHDEDPLTSSSR